MKTIKSILPAWGALAIWMIAASGYAQTYTFTTLAGSPSVPGAMDGTNQSARFNGPSGVALDSSGRIYVADQLNNVIRMVAPVAPTGNWAVTTIAGNINMDNFGQTDGTNAAAEFNFPAGLALDQAGNIFVADQDNNVIRKITQSGTNWVVTTIAGRGANFFGTNDGVSTNSRFSNPSALAVDASENIYVADQGNHTIRKLAFVGGSWVTSTIAGQPTNPGFGNGTNLSSQFNAPSGVAVDSAGRIFVADMGNNAIRLLTPSGPNWVSSTISGQGPIKPGFRDGTNITAQLNAPAGVAADTNGNVYVADQGNNTIRKMTPSGTNWVLTTMGGTAQTSGTNDGLGTNALFFMPFALAVDGRGSVYVADSNNETIRAGFLRPTILNTGVAFGFSASHFGFNLTGPQGRVVVVQASSDLVNWQPISTNTFGPGPLYFSDPQGNSFPQHFYRAELP